jgi:hypothetical protein
MMKNEPHSMYSTYIFNMLSLFHGFEGSCTCLANISRSFLEHAVIAIRSSLAAGRVRGRDASLVALTDMSTIFYG